MAINSITLAGHSAVFLHADSLTMVIDPFLTGNPICPDSLRTPKAVDLIMLTHGHGDHVGDTVALAKKHNASVIAIWELANILVELGVPEDRVIPVGKGGTVAFKGIQITYTNAFHSSSIDTPQGTRYAGEPAGIVVRDGTTSIYHAGDTCLFGDMALLRVRYKPDIALLPIGDRFTMGPEDAAEAARLVGCRVAIPIHYKTFDMLTGTAEAFTNALKGSEIEAVVLDPGVQFDIPRRR